MSQGSTSTAPRDFIAYEYLTVQVDRDLEPLYRDTYQNFGWVLDGYGPTIPNVTHVSLKLKRDRRIKNRSMVLELQRKAENALGEIVRLERSKSSAALGTALSIGILGTAFLAGSVFLVNDDQWGWSIPLGALGLLGWLFGFLGFGWVRSRRTAEVAPLIDHQYDVVYETSEQAAHLLS